MKIIQIAILIALVFLIIPFSNVKALDEDEERQSFVKTPADTLTFANTTKIHSIGCIVHLYNFVYHPARLITVDSCVLVKGVIKQIKNEADADKHILVALDQKYQFILNDGNKKQNNTLIVEPICQSPAKTNASKLSCVGYDGPIFNLTNITGKHVSMKGVLVLDTDHSYQAEIHPLSKMTVLKR